MGGALPLGAGLLPEGVVMADIGVSWDPIRGTVSVDPCPDCGAGAGEYCAWACSSNWDAEDRAVSHD